MSEARAPAGPDRRAERASFLQRFMVRPEAPAPGVPRRALGGLLARQRQVPAALEPRVDRGLGGRARGHRAGRQPGGSRGRDRHLHRLDAGPVRGSRGRGRRRTGGLILPLLAGVGHGRAGGAVNGLLVTLGRIPSIIVTLGMLYALRGVILLVTGGTWITGVPDATRFLGTGTMLGIGVPGDNPPRPVRRHGARQPPLDVGAQRLRRRRQPAGRPLRGAAHRPRAVSRPSCSSGCSSASRRSSTSGRAGSVQTNAGVGLELQVVAAVVIGGHQHRGRQGVGPGRAHGGGADRRDPERPDPARRAGHLAGRGARGPDPAGRRDRRAAPAARGRQGMSALTDDRPAAAVLAGDRPARRPR